MENRNGDIGLILSGQELAVVGADDAVRRFLGELQLNPDAGRTAKKATLDAVAAATGLSTLSAGLAGQTYTLTADSAKALSKLQEYNVDGSGTLAGVIRGAKGQIATHARFEPTQLNPVVVSNLATLAAVAALRAAIADLEKVVEAMDVKIDRLLADNRAKAMGEVQGITHVLTKVYALYEETGLVSETAWAQVSGHSTALAQSLSYALNQLDAITESLGARSAVDRASAAQLASDTELREWLVLLAACQANHARLDALEIAHAAQASEGAFEAHVKAVRDAAAHRKEMTGLRLQKLNDAVSTAADVKDLNRVLNPLRTRSTLDAAENIQRMVQEFAKIYGLENLVYGTVERESWRKSLGDLGAMTRGVIGSSAASVPQILNQVKPPAQALRAVKFGRLKGAGKDQNEIEPSMATDQTDGTIS